MTVEDKKFRSEIVIYLHSYQAIRMVRGRPFNPEEKKHYIPGLLTFANTARQAWIGSRADDPWADAWLIKAEDMINQARSKLLACMEEVNQALETLPENMRVSTAQVEVPQKIELQFSAPHPNQASILLVQFDELASKIFTTRHMGIATSSQAAKWLSRGRKANIALYWLAGEYKLTGVTRADVVEKNAKYLQAVEKYGEVEEAVLLKKVMPEHRY